MDADRHLARLFSYFLVALIRRVCGLDAKLSTFDDTVHRNFQNWVMKHHTGDSEKFNEEQMDWLRMIRDHVAVRWAERAGQEASTVRRKAGCVAG